MILFFYNFALFVALVAGAPWWLWRMAITRKYREGLMERLGRVPRRLVSERLRPSASRSTRPLIWLHAVSVGEVLAVTRLVKALESALPDYSIVISTTTRTGQALARERFGFESRLLLPARPALGRPRLSQRAPAAPAHPCRNRILAQSASRLLSPRNSRRGGQRPHLQSFLAALPQAALVSGVRCSRASAVCLRKARLTPTACSSLAACPIAFPSPAI